MNTKINTSDYLLLAIYFIIDIIMGIFDYHENQSQLAEYLLDLPVGLITALLMIFMFMNWLIPKYIVYTKKYILFVCYSLLMMIILGTIDYTVNFYSGNNDWTKYPSFWKLIRVSINWMSEMISLPLGLLLGKKYYEGQLQYSDIQRRQKENELKLLRSQIDPHFLFNNLNTLDALIDSNPEKAKEYINRLSLIYRYLIQTKEAEVMELTEEIRFAENYIFLIQTRFGEDYTFNIEKKGSIDNKFIPTSALQTLLENIVKHNKTQNNEPIVTKILIEDEWLTVTNTKSTADSKNESLGTGLENMKKRYALLSNQKIALNNTSNEFKISIPILKLSTESE